MGFYRIPQAGSDDVLLLISPTGVRAGTVAAAPEPPTGEIVPLVIAEYVDTAGVFHTTAVTSGSTTINGVAPFMMHIDASGSRFPTAFAAQSSITDEDAYAYLMGGYRINYGEGLGGTWPFGGVSRDEDTGPPIFGRVFTTVGNHLVRIKMRDTIGNEQTVSFNVNVTAPAAPTIIETSAGGWPTWVSGTHYALRAGENYTSFGVIDLREKHNIIISKTGTGADPRIGAFLPDGRWSIDAPEESWVLTRGVRTLDIDVGVFDEGGPQALHVGVIRGRCRTFTGGSMEYFYDHNAPTNNARSSIRQTVGMFFWDCGEIVRGASNYVMIGFAGHRHIIGCDLHMDTPAGASVSVMRTYDHESSIRHCHFRNSTQDGQMQTWIAMIGMSGGLSYPDYVAIPWQAQIGASDGSGFLKVINRKHCVHNCIFGRPADPWPNAAAAIGGTANTSWISELYGIEDSFINKNEPTNYGQNQNVVTAGHYHFRRNVKYATGGDLSLTTTPPIDPAWNGPYLIETNNSRPVPTTFT